VVPVGVEVVDEDDGELLVSEGEELLPDVELLPEVPLPLVVSVLEPLLG
jgi:hypothetical protein